MVIDLAEIFYTLQKMFGSDLVVTFKSFQFAKIFKKMCNSINIANFVL